MPLASNLTAVGANARGRNAAFPSLRPVLADRCRSPQGYLPSMRVRHRGCSSAQRFRAHSRLYGWCGYGHAVLIDCSRTADAWVSVLRHDHQSWVAGHERKQCFEQLLKRRSKGRFWNVRVGSAEFSDTACVGLQEGCNWHGNQLANEQIT
jgi:hypothetical protein